MGLSPFMRHEESLGNSLTPSNGTWETNTIPWYIDKNNQNVDLYGSRRSRISQKSLNPAWQQQPQIVENMSQRVTPEFFDNRKRGLDVNRYATKKTIAQGMLDVALLTANASQLKYVLQLGEDKHDFYYLMLALIILSIVLQAIVALLFLVIGGFNINEEPNEKVADILNDIITVLVFVITVINVIINGFGLSFVEPLNSGIK